MTSRLANMRLVACHEPSLGEASGFAIGVAVLPHDPVSLADGPLVHGLQSVVAEQCPDEPRLENEERSGPGRGSPGSPLSCFVVARNVASTTFNRMFGFALAVPQSHTRARDWDRVIQVSCVRSFA